MIKKIHVKFIFVLWIILFWTQICKSQNVYYFSTSYTCIYLLDSLNIPYLPMNERVQKSMYLGCSEERVQEFKNFFNDNQFVFNPDLSTPSVPLEYLFLNSEFVHHDDEFIMSLLILQGNRSVGFADVPIIDKYYSMVRIVELMSSNDSFTTIVLFQTKDDKWDFIEDESSRVPDNYEVSYK